MDNNVEEHTTCWKIRSKNSDPSEPARRYVYRRSITGEGSSAAGVLNVHTDSEGAAFEDRLKEFAQRQSTISIVAQLRQESLKELQRRQTEREARRLQEESSGGQMPAGDQQQTPKVIEQSSRPYVFESPSKCLTDTERKTWQASIRNDAMLTYPHQWLRLASIFSVQSKTARQSSLLTQATQKAAFEDAGITESNKPENYLKIRDIQNRNYARDA